MTDRGRTGRFTKGNSAARGRRSPPRITARLIELIDNRLGEQGELRSLDELVVSAVLQLAEAASGGDLKACQWIADRFYPRESEPLIQRRRFPSPSQEPLKFLDALSKSVGHGDLSTAQAVRLAQLSKPFVLDEALGELLQKFEELSNSVNALEKQRLQVVK